MNSVACNMLQLFQSNFIISAMIQMLNEYSFNENDILYSQFEIRI
jgi:hypothetical protein